MSKHLIDDEYTKPGYIAAVERLHDSLAFTFRPMLAEEVDAVSEAADGKPAREKSRLIRAVLAKQIVDWDVEDGRDTAVVNVENVRRLPWRVVNQLYNMVAGLIPTDENPDALKAEPETVADIIEAAATGRTFGIVSEERDRKN